MCPGSHSHCAGEHRTAGNVNVITNLAIMLNYGSTVDYDIAAEFCACVHYAPR
jgi:hypothetical protein